MKRSQLSAKTLIKLAVLSLGASHAYAADLEEVYNHYLQGNYKKAQEELNQIIKVDPKGEDLLNMKQKVGVRALLEMSQNEFLRDKMKIFNAAAWQEERSQFKAPRRIRFFINEFMTDDSTRHKSLPNVLAAGMYAIPHIIPYLKVENEDMTTRGLAFQLLLNMGSEAIPGLLPCTFSKDPVLLVNTIRLLAKLKSPRSIPYLLRLKTVDLSDMVREDLDIALASFNLPAGLTPIRAYLDEANRYLCELSGVRYDSVEADGVLWRWDSAEENVVSDNPLGLSFEYQPQYPSSLWPMFRAELMHREFMETKGGTEVEEQAIHAATLCNWVVQEHRVQELLKDPVASGCENLVEPLKAFLDTRSNKLTVAHWLGQDILLQALDMAQYKLGPQICARILRMIAGYQPKGAEVRSIGSFTTGDAVQPLLAGLNSREELIRYWSAIAIARCDKSLQLEASAHVVDLLQQAIDEIGTPSALILSKPTPDAEALHKKMEEMGYLVQRVDNVLEGFAALRSFPSKDLLIIDPDFDRTMDGLAFINKVRMDQKGKDLPIVVLSDEARSGGHVITFQEQAQQMVLGSDSIQTLKDKLSGLNSKHYDVVGPDLAADVSRESLTALAFLDEAALRRFPSLVAHLVDLLNSPQQPESSQILAIRTLRKLGTLAESSVNVLLARLDDSAYEVNYKIVVLHALLSVANANEHVRAKLFEIITDAQSPDSFKQMAASYLSGEFQKLNPEERATFQKSFFSPSFLNGSGS